MNENNEPEKQVKRRGNPLWDLSRMTWRYSKYKKKVVLFLSMFSIAGLIDILIRPFVWSMIFDFIQQHNVTRENFTEICKLLALLLGLTIVFWLFHGPSRVLERENAFRARISYKQYLLSGVMALSIKWHSNHPSGDTIDKLNKGGEGLYDYSKDSFRVLYEIVNLTVSVGVLTYFFPFSAVLMFCFMSVCVAIILKFDKILVAQYKELSRMDNGVSAGVLDSLSNIKTIITLRAENSVFQSVAHKTEKPVDLNSKNVRLNEIKWFLINIIITSMVILILGVYMYHQSGTTEGVSAGGFFLLYRYLEKVGSVFNNFAGMYGDIVQNRASVMNAEELSQHFTKEGLTNHVLPSDWNTISIRGLSFKYDASKSVRQLSEINLDLHKGKRYAFVGESGCGKTTLLELIRGLHKPESLNLSVDGVEVPDGFDGIARAIALIPQSPEILVGTVEANITLGAEISLEEILRSCDTTMFTSVLKDLPSGLATHMNEKGVNLSVGQKQRLALARGVSASRDKSVLLLDEPTSGQDNSTECAVYENIFREFPNATIISSLHRLHLLPMFDVVCFFQKGQITAMGTFDELLNTCSDFKTLYERGKKSKRKP